MQVIGVNSGNYNIKAKSASAELLFKTRAATNEDADKFIIYDDKKYEIGDGSSDIIHLKDDSLVHNLCTLYAISSLLTQPNIFLVTCLPVNQFKNKAIRRDYALSLEGSHLFETERGTKRFTITRNVVYMEGAAAVLANMALFKDRYISVVDIGGYNVNISQYSNGRLVHGTEDDFDFGMYKVKADIAAEFNRISNTHYKEEELSYIIKRPESWQKEVIDRCVADFFDQLKFSLKKKGYNINVGQYFFTGGGAEELANVIPYHFKDVVIGSIFDTARGLYEVGVRQCASV